MPMCLPFRETHVGVAVENSAVAEAGELSIAEYLLRTNKAMMSDANQAKPET